MESIGESSVISMPQKRFFRQRAHSNPMSDHILDCPSCPDEFDYRCLYEAFTESNDDTKITMLDVGCGYGGLLVALSPLFPDCLILGMEIRVKVSAYVQQKIAALRSQGVNCYQNIACIRSNAMKSLPFFFKKGQLTKMFFLYPDPHFKKSKHKWRIINRPLLDEYAYVLAIGGILYVATDVEEYIQWVEDHFEKHLLFNKVADHQLESDPLHDVILNSTEEGQKVARSKGRKFLAAFVRVSDPFLRPEA